MVPRSVRALSALLLVWLCAIAGGPARHPEPVRLVVRGTAAVALREVADAPLLAPRAVTARDIAVRPVDRDAPPHGLTPASRSTLVTAIRAREARQALARQSRAHGGRPRWRPYDAAAPPVRSLSAR
jgi:hypothetical protein